MIQKEILFSFLCSFHVYKMPEHVCKWHQMVQKGTGYKGKQGYTNVHKGKWFAKVELLSILRHAPRTKESDRPLFAAEASGSHFESHIINSQSTVWLFILFDLFGLLFHCFRVVTKA